jgi:uncharacterized cupredoxin-like copper-binding protein
MRGMKRCGLVELLLALGLGACGGDDDPAVDSAGGDATTTAPAVEAKSEVHRVAFTAKDYSYAMPKEVKSGTVEFTMKNEGKELHIASLARVAPGKTFNDAQKALLAPPGTPAPADPPATDIAGISSVSPGLSGNETVQLEPGTYYFACFIPSADGSPHVAKGMIQPFTVVADEADAAKPDTAAGKVTAKDFAYETTYQAKAGSQVIEFTNAGGQGHEITLLEFPAGKGPGDLAAYFAKPEGPAPATFYGGPVVDKGGTVTWKTPALESGKTYFFMCLIPDPADGVPHAAKGMLLPIQVS